MFASEQASLLIKKREDTLVILSPRMKPPPSHPRSEVLTTSRGPPGVAEAMF